MVGKPRRVPSYCRHKASGQAVVRIGGTDHYLGVYGSPESHERYQRIIAERFQNRRESMLGNLVNCHPNQNLTVVELIAAYWEFAQGYYLKGGVPTSELSSLRLAFRPLKKLYGTLKAVDFGPLALEAVRNTMVEAGITRKRINQHVGRIRRMFKWGVSKQLLPVEIHSALMTIDGLKKGRSKAVESKPVAPVKAEIVEATLPLLPSPLQDMIRLHYLLGCRPEEITILRPCDLFSRDKEVWEYVPESHKTEHHDRDRRICVGKQAQQILSKWLDRDPLAYCFSPAESRQQFDDTRRANRKTPHTPSSRKRKRKTCPSKQPGLHYTTCSYGSAIRKVCKKAGIPNWSPNQLRHSRATAIRQEFGLEASQVVLGHSNANVTQIYAERDFELARSVMKEIG